MSQCCRALGKRAALCSVRATLEISIINDYVVVVLYVLVSLLYLSILVVFRYHTTGLYLSLYLERH